MDDEATLQQLCNSILEGRCVAFVGAGFSAPGGATWSELLDNLAKRSGDKELASEVHRRLFEDKRATPALEFEGLAQTIREAFDSAHSETVEQSARAAITIEEMRARETARKKACDAVWEGAIKECLKKGGDETTGNKTVNERVELLKKIPFRAILTTNFDDFLDGEEPTSDLYREILRGEHPWWNRNDTPREGRGLPRAPVVKLHGDADGDPTRNPVVLHRSMYRERLYSDPRYATFVRSVFAQYDVLFLGVSFTDAYLNELRSEILNMLYREGQPKQASPWGYAVLADPTRTWMQFLRDHEGIATLSYSAANHHAAFKPILQNIVDRTSMSAVLKPHLEGEGAVLWVDPNADNNREGQKFFGDVGVKVVLKDKVSDATDDELRCAKLILVCSQDPEVKDRSHLHAVMQRLHRAGSEGEAHLAADHRKHPPVVVFASSRYANRRAEAISLGAWEYTTGWVELYQVLRRLFNRYPGAHSPPKGTEP